VAPLPLANVTLPPLPIEKPDQSITALRLVWVTVVVEPLLPIRAVPATTWPPLGICCA